MVRSVDNGDFGWTAFDLDAGREIPLLISADDDTGEFEAFAQGPNGLPYYDPATNDAAKVRGRCRLVLVGPDESLPVIVTR